MSDEKKNTFPAFPDSAPYFCRKLRIDDLEKVMHWRMSPHVTRYMNTDPILTLKGQKRWFEKLSSEMDIYYWIIYVGTIPCGVINFADIDTTNKRCSWGCYVAEKKLRSFDLAIALEDRKSVV